MTERLDVVCTYHSPAKAALLRDGVLPLLHVADERGVTVHLERHWLHGPHVRVCLAGPAGKVRETAETVAGRLRAYLAAHPSTASPGTAVLLAQAEAAGRAELIPPPYTSIHPDNTVRVEPADRAALIELLGSPDAVACRDELLRLGLPAVAHALRHTATEGDTASARVAMTIVAMTSHSAHYPLGFGAAQQSFVSHAEDYLLYHDPDGALRRAFDARWHRHAEEITALVARIADGRETAPAEVAWASWTVAARAAAEPVYDLGSLPTAPDEAYTRRAARVGDPATARRWNFDLRTEYSEFHQLSRRIDYGRLDHEREFTVYRFATNVLYLLLGLCDVQPGERQLAAYLVGRAAERITGLTWRERLNRYLAIQAATAEEPPP